MKSVKKWKGVFAGGLAALLVLCASCDFMSTESMSSKNPVGAVTAGTGTESSGGGQSESGGNCSAEESSETEENTGTADEDTVEVDRTWTILVYMAADNDLESYAIADINEMERAVMAEDITVLALVDRCDGYDYSNGNWSDTRLFEIRYDSADCGSLIVSKEINCPALELYTDSVTEVDMANEQTLANVLSYVKNAYTAEHYGLVMWGHGSGWRSDTGGNVVVEIGGDGEGGVEIGGDGEGGVIGNGEAVAGDAPFRAFSIDDTSGTTMDLVSLSRAVKSVFSGQRLDFLGMDTCFGLSLEIAYQLRDCVSYLAGTPSLVPCGGWNYEALFTDFSRSGKTVEDLCALCVSHFSKLYSYYAYACFSAIDCSKASALVSAFEAFCTECASGIVDAASQKRYLGGLLNSRQYCADTYPCDVYLDICSMVNHCLCLDETLSESAAALFDALCDAVSWSWDSSSGASGVDAVSVSSSQDVSLGVFFNVFLASSVMDVSHSERYIHGNRSTGQCDFVMESEGYAPSVSKNTSLLDKLCYAVF